MPSSFADGIAPEKCGVVQVRALSAGRFSLPENQFVSPCVEGGRKTVPSLCFLIQHKDPATGKATRIVFDLGLRRDINRYSEPIRRHTETRQPMSTDPDVVKSLKKGGLMPDDIDYVIYSHVSRLCPTHPEENKNTSSLIPIVTPELQLPDGPSRFIGITLASLRISSTANS